MPAPPDQHMIFLPIPLSSPCALAWPNRMVACTYLSPSSLRYLSPSESTHSESGSQSSSNCVPTSIYLRGTIGILRFDSGSLITCMRSCSTILVKYSLPAFYL